MVRAMQVHQNVPLAALTTFEIGGPAQYFVDVHSEDEVREAIRWAREKAVPIIVWAGGSNILIPDEGLKGLVMRIVGKEHVFSGETLEAHAGCNLLSLIREAAERSLGGWEKLAGIPGTIGGAVRGNAGAFGPEMKEFVTVVQALNLATGQKRDFDNSKCDFSYRHSFSRTIPNG
jgi:UDP-N-acetylmuramate dehydrogenase